MSDDNDQALAAVNALAERDEAILQAFGIAVTDVRADRVSLTMTVTAQMLNSQSVCHGAFLFALADTAGAYAAAATGFAPVTLDAHIAFVAAARLGDTLEATGNVIRAGGRAAHCEVTVTRSDGAPVCSFRCAMLNQLSSR